jgi:hypothetical protein
MDTGQLPEIIVILKGVKVPNLQVCPGMSVDGSLIELAAGPRLVGKEVELAAGPCLVGKEV